MSGVDGVSESTVRADIAALLDVDPSTIGDGDDLIGLGLDSIRMMRLAGGWRKLGHDVNFADLAASPTVADWSAMLGAADAEPAGASGVTEQGIGGFDAEDWAADSFPLAPMQHAYWVGRTGAADLGGVAAHLYVEFDGAGLDPDRLAAAAEALVARHGMLRARFGADGRQQVLDALPRPALVVDDLRGTDSADIERLLTERRESKSHQVLDIAAGQVFDLTLTLLPGGRHRLHFDIDMLAADAMSYRTLLRDLVALYDGAQLPPLSVGYRDYLRHRAEHPDSARAADRDWWADRLADLPGGPILPARPAGQTQSDRARVVRMNHWLDAGARAGLLAAAHERGVTPAAVVGAVYAASVGAWSSTPHFLLNVPLFQRVPMHDEIDAVSGDFSSSILVDVDLRVLTAPGNGSVLDLARDVQRRMHEAGSHSAYGALDILRDLGRLRGETVLAPVVFTSALGLGELFADEVYARLGRPAHIVSQGPQVLLDAQITEVGGGLLTNWDVRIDQFPDGVVEAMFEHFTTTLDGLAAGGSSAGWLAEALPQLPASQRAVRCEVNNTAAPTTGRVLHQGFFEVAAEDPERPALLWRDGGLAYGELAPQALAVAAALRSAGVRPGDAVGVQIPKGYRQMIATLGVYAAGAVWVPVTYDQPAPRRAAILRTAEAALLLTDGVVEPDRLEVPALELSDALAAAPLSGPYLPDPEAVAYVLFTSGSTGTPKGVEVPHRAAMNTIDDVNRRFGVGPGDRSLTVAALEFDISVYDIFGLYSAGGAVIAVGADDAKDPAAWRDLLVAHRASVLTCVPSALDMLLTLAETETGGGALGDSLRAVLLGGDWVGADLPGRLRSLAPGARFAGLGGATEIAIHGTVCEVSEPPAHWTSVPFGTPLANVACRVVSDLGTDCPDWVSGELWVGGDGVAHGYRNEPQRTAERFVEFEGRRWYRTGDLARYWPDGTVEFLGRADNQVKIRGFRVELGEIEGALRTLPSVRHAVAVLVAGNGPATLAAVVAPEPGSAPNPDELRDSLADLVPGYMVPAVIDVRAELPLTGNGKLDRAAITASLGTTAADSSPRRDPETDLHRALLAIMADVLGGDRELGVDDDFFAAGGDSVLATTVIARVRDLLDAPQAGVADIFAARTVDELARRLDDADERPGRLEQVAAIYLEIAAMDDEELMAQ
ncbi:non-ribosomal peptide synthetase [Gordonia neofelifaecis]|uniref:Phenyloxazoline synthase MbtB n=1 Tax=Gordonia neofelifaecis NRRL B-59395 TaxID=644548 RepID=F1YJM4_9ACTN|nr:non-ribosomal peptide synthetase [Gordonia neofelifaecis]EGD54956.1 amino acid adenylation domain-containing protein [Gordonia neofelifaecis NRRL B-59395]